MTKKAETGTYHGPRSGPPGDDTVYLMPRDFAKWEKAWEVHAEPLSVTRRGQSQVELDMSPEAVAEREERKRRHAEAVAYVNQYTGQWGLPLDIKARRDWGTAKVKLSEAQVDALLKGRDRDLERTAQAFANRHPRYDEAIARIAEVGLFPNASEFIVSLGLQVAAGRILTDRQVEAVLRGVPSERQPAPAPQDPELAPQPSPAPAMAGDVSDGWYMVDGEPWKVQWNLDHTGRYAKRLVPRDRRDGDAGSDLGAKPKWVYVQGGLGIVARKGQRMTIEHAAQYGKLYGACAVCGRTLTFEGSIERGIGPICYGRIAQ